jgi:hypothetical protein
MGPCIYLYLAYLVYICTLLTYGRGLQRLHTSYGNYANVSEVVHKAYTPRNSAANGTR